MKPALGKSAPSASWIKILGPPAGGEGHKQVKEELIHIHMICCKSHTLTSMSETTSSALTASKFLPWQCWFPRLCYPLGMNMLIFEKVHSARKQKCM
eukprot:5211175-Amphidinium_carterae.1